MSDWINSSEIETSQTTSEGTAKTVAVTCLCSPDAASGFDPAGKLPSGYVYDGHTKTEEDGVVKFVVRGILYELNASFGAERTTFRVDMQECTYDLEDHDDLEGVRDVCMKWIADGCIKIGADFYVLDAQGDQQKIEDEFAQKFCKAYMAGIKTFNRYFPVIERISEYKNPPGLNMSGKSFTGGQMSDFSKCGTFDTPPIQLAGYSQGGWFKSKDSWVENANKSWSRTEQWTWTPDGANSQHAWIYA